MGVIHLPYGKEVQRGEISGDIRVLEPNDVHPPQDEETLIHEAAAGYKGDLSFRQFADLPGEMLIIVNDASRPTPTARVLKVLMKAADLSSAQCIVATGAHRAPTASEYRYIFGETLEFFRDRIIVHDARCSEDMVFLGTSKGGTELAIHRAAAEADKILVIGSVEPHYFAGYTGGRKAFFPGVASYRSIEQNHKRAMESGAESLRLEGNPVHQDMTDALECIKAPVFALMTVLDKDNRIYRITSGDITRSFLQAVEAADQVFVAETDEAVDIAVTAAKYPMDVDLYQSQKALENARQIVKPGGVIILVSACREGAGDDAFIKLLSSADTPDDVLKKIHCEYRLGWHKAGKLADLSVTHHIFAVTPLPDALLRDMFITPFSALQDALDEAEKITGRNPKVIVMSDGCVTVPRIRQHQR